MTIRREKFQTRRCSTQKRGQIESFGGDVNGDDGDEHEVVCIDDFEVVVDELENENDESGLGVEEASEYLAENFGDIVRNDLDELDGDSGDEIWNEDIIPNIVSSDDEEEAKCRELHGDIVDNDEFLALGKTFGCASDFKLALLRYSLKTKYDIKFYKSTSKKLGAKCSDEECPWRVYCSFEKHKHKMQIKIYENVHICIRSGYSKMLKISSIAQLFDERLRINPKFTKKDMAVEIKREYHLIVTEEQCGKANSKLVCERKTSHEIHFSRIWDYQAEILKSNPWSTMDIETIPGPTPESKKRFHRLYVCFTSQRKSWMQTCRPIIGLDGAFLKWDIKGHLLAAVGRDGDNRIVSIAWAVVEIENNTNWDWFVKHLKDDLRLGEGENITIISDKQKGLVNAVHNDLPQAKHRMCARHILANWRKDNKDLELERLFWKIARSYTKEDFADNMETLRNHNTGAYDSLQRTNPMTWSRAFFRLGSFCNDNLNNLSESFNRTIRDARRKPLLDMLEDIRKQCMVRNAKRSIIANRLQTRFTKRAHAEIELARDKSKDCIRYMATGDLHEIDYHGVTYRVDMGMKTCGCVKWQLTGIPCIHAICVITAKKLKVDDFVSDFYTTQKWRQTYERGIKPVQGMKLWPRLNKLPVLPPPYRLSNRGRPSTHARRKERNESSNNKTKLTRERRIMTCTNFREEGHNKATCSKLGVEREAKQSKGRPKKDQVRKKIWYYLPGIFYYT